MKTLTPIPSALSIATRPTSEQIVIVNQSQPDSMTKEEIESRFMSKHGQFVSIVFRRPMKTYKNFSHLTVEKLTKLTARAGCNYDNLKAVIDARTNGTIPGVNAGLSWGQWENKPYTVTHKGKRYFAFQPVETTTPTESRYFLNGEETNLETIVPYCRAEEFQDNRHLTFFLLTENYIVSLA